MQVDRRTNTDFPADFRWPRVVIVGAGMSGVCLGIALRRGGSNNFVIYEKGTAVGGTWRENTYPGLHCDVPSHHYRYSFDPNPEWSRTFSDGPEIKRYFEDSARKFGVDRHIRFDSRVVDAKWDGARWEVTLADGSRDMADILVSATGFLHVPVYPKIEGVDSFAGAAFHTALWDHSIDLSDKRIGLIGTGSTATQIVSELAGKVKRLTLFQRTAQWVFKLENPPISEGMKRRFRRWPWLMRLMYAYYRFMLGSFTFGGISGSNPIARRMLVKNTQGNLETVRDPVLRKKLTPTYAVGCKRLVMSPNFYEAVQDPTVNVVTSGITRIEPGGVRAQDGELHELDLLVFATGFDLTAHMRPMRLTGENGLTIDEAWAEGPRAYRSMMMPGFPNFFMYAGPYSPIGNISLVLMSELVTDYFLKCIRLIAERDVALAPTEQATDAVMAQYKRDAARTIWATGGCRSWYLDKDGIPMIYPYSPTQFTKEMRRPLDLWDFKITPLRKEDSRRTARRRA